MYYSYLFSDYLERHEKLQKEIDVALVEDDDELFSKKQLELKCFEGVFSLALSVGLIDEPDS